MVYRSSAPMTEHNISVSGGGDTRYYVSGSLFDQASLIPELHLEDITLELIQREILETASL